MNSSARSKFSPTTFPTRWPRSKSRQHHRTSPPASGQHILPYPSGPYTPYRTFKSSLLSFPAVSSTRPPSFPYTMSNSPIPPVYDSAYRKSPSHQFLLRVMLTDLPTASHMYPPPSPAMSTLDLTLPRKSTPTVQHANLPLSQYRPGWAPDNDIITPTRTLHTRDVATTSTEAQTPPPPHRPLSPIAFVGGGAVALALVLVGLFCCWRRRRTARKVATEGVEMGVERRDGAVV